MSVSSDLLTLGAVAAKLGVPPWRVRRLFESGRLSEPRRAGQNRIFSEADVDVIRRALRLPSKPTVVAG